MPVLPSSPTLRFLPLENGHRTPMTDLPFSPDPGHLANRLFGARTLVLGGVLTPQAAQRAMEQLTAMAAAGPAPLTLHLSAQGGDAEAGDALFDFVRFIEPAVRMVGTGGIDGPAALVYAAVPRADRYALPNARFRLRQPDPARRTRDVVAEADAVRERRRRLVHLFAEATGQPPDRIEHDLKKGPWMNAEEAQAYGLVGRVVTTLRDVPG